MLVTMLLFAFVLEEFQKRFKKKLYARVIGPYYIIRKMRSNAHLLDLLNDIDIRPVFNVEDLLPYRDTFEPSILPSIVSAGEVSKGGPTMPSLQYSKETVDISLLMSVTSKDGGLRRFLVKGHGRPDSDVTWIQKDDLRIWILRCWIATFPLTFRSRVFFQPEGNDKAWSRPVSRPRRDRKPKSNNDFYYY